MKILPSKELKSTNKISELCNEKNEPIFITKHGYGDLVVMSIKTYNIIQERLTALNLDNTDITIDSFPQAKRYIEYDNNNNKELIVNAMKLFIEQGNASTSLLQRKFAIGYARAATIIDVLEENGFITSLIGSTPREVLITKEEFEEKLKAGTLFK